MGGYCVKLIHEPIDLELIDRYSPDLVISYNYQYIIKEDVINAMGGQIINMHISFLPWNRGASPNVWSFIDDTPKGVTIHRLEKGLDTGKIIVQRELFFDENVETLSTTYQKLNAEIVNLFMENWENIRTGNFSLMEQEGKGSYHRTADLERVLNGRRIDYDMTIAEFKGILK